MRLREAVEKSTHLRLVDRAKSPVGERMEFDERIELRQVLHDEITATLLRDYKSADRRVRTKPQFDLLSPR
jgi:hypothetical protein